MRNYKGHSYYLVVLLLMSEFALWVILRGILVLLVPRRRRQLNRTPSHDPARPALREERYNETQVDVDNGARGLLYLKIAIAGEEPRDAAELRMGLGWAQSVWPKALTSVEVSRNGRAIIFAPGIKREATDNPFWRSALRRGVERVELDTPGSTRTALD